MFNDISIKLILSLGKLGESRFNDLKSFIKNSRSLSINLKKLMNMGLVENVNGLYKLTDRGVKVNELLREIHNLISLSSLKIENFERIPHLYFSHLIKRYCELLLDYFGDRLISIMLFGSIARGDWSRDSDIDILIVVDGWNDKPIWVRIGELKNVKKMLEDTFEFKRALNAGFWPIIQNYPLSLEEAKRFNRIYLDAIIDGIILYDKNDFLRNVLDKIRRRMEALGSMRITLPNGKFYWVLKGDIIAGEVIDFE
ncbi:MAG: nucleotidyltransferase domain-containing protein [Candidatus Methanomethylicia archaeon]